MTSLTADSGTRFSPSLRKVVWGAGALLLLLPAIALQITGEVNWDATDFLLFAGLLLAACAAFELAWRASRNSFAYLAGAGLAIGTAFMIVWSSLAAGIIRDGGHPAEYLFHAAWLVALVGGLLARRQAAGTGLAMYAASALCAVGAVCALALDGPVVFAITLVFIVAFLGAAELFRKAAAAG